MSVEFDLYTFGGICVFVIPLVVVVAIVVSVLLSAVARHSPTGMHVLLLFSYLFAFGVVTHELAHRLFYALFGVKVTEARYFQVARQKTADLDAVSIGGYVDCEEIPSVIAALFTGFAPLIVNGLLVALLIYYGPFIMTTPYYGLAIYGGISLGLGVRLSKEDLLMWVDSLRKRPGRGVLEFVGLFLFIGLLYYLGTILQVPLWGIFSLFLAFIILVILYNRRKPTALKD